jgi:radical SAM/SPASM domain protein of ACGX system
MLLHLQLAAQQTQYAHVAQLTQLQLAARPILPAHAALQIQLAHAAQLTQSKAHSMKPAFAFQWHITDECDQRCEHCYIFSNGACAGFERMSWDEMTHVISSAEEMCESFGRVPYFYVTGGDPILHPEFWRLAGLLHEQGHMWCVMGNPFHITDDVAARMKALGCRKYQLSLDGLEATHDRFRKPGSFAETMRAIKCLQKAGIWVAIMNTVSSVNAPEIPQLIDLAAQLEVDVFTFGRYCPTSGQKRDEFHIAPADYRAFLLRCQERIDAHQAAGCKTYFQLKDHLWKLLLWEQGRFEIPADAKPGMIYDGCHCATGHMTILPDGRVFACRRMESCVGNVHEASLREIFLSQAMEEKRNFKAFEKCQRCKLFSWCRGCPAVSYGYTGNMYAPDPQCWAEV